MKYRNEASKRASETKRVASLFANTSVEWIDSKREDVDVFDEVRIVWDEYDSLVVSFFSGSSKSYAKFETKLVREYSRFGTVLERASLELASLARSLEDEEGGN